jgi:hypothetical protein
MRVSTKLAQPSNAEERHHAVISVTVPLTYAARRTMPDILLPAAYLASGTHCGVKAAHAELA